MKDTALYRIQEMKFMYVVRATLNEVHEIISNNIIKSGDEPCSLAEFSQAISEGIFVHNKNHSVREITIDAVKSEKYKHISGHEFALKTWISSIGALLLMKSNIDRKTYYIDSVTGLCLGYRYITNNVNSPTYFYLNKNLSNPYSYDMLYRVFGDIIKNMRITKSPEAFTILREKLVEYRKYNDLSELYLQIKNLYHPYPELAIDLFSKAGVIDFETLKDDIWSLEEKKYSQ